MEKCWLQVLHTEGADAGTRASITTRDTLVGQKNGVCVWDWHSQPTRDQS